MAGIEVLAAYPNRLPLASGEAPSGAAGAMLALRQRRNNVYTPEMPWTVPVRVRLQSGVERSFSSVYDALDFLHNEWPTRHGYRYNRAIQQCGDALRRALPSAVAREAFIAACLEAGMSTGGTRRAVLKDVLRGQPTPAPEQSPADIDRRFPTP